MLPILDTDYLKERAPNHLVSKETNMTCVLIPNYQLPEGFDRTHADLLLRLSAGYPDVPPDMWWFDPPVRSANGQTIPATDVVEQYLGRRWQRWSRHLGAGQWKSGVDTLESFMALLRRELEKSALVFNR